VGSSAAAAGAGRLRADGSVRPDEPVTLTDALLQNLVRVEVLHVNGEAVPALRVTEPLEVSSCLLLDVHELGVADVADDVDGDRHDLLLSLGEAVPPC
jgi:hypothetical protein